jgi:hypothetical protein
MNKEKKIAIAVACGYRHIPERPNPGRGGGLLPEQFQRPGENVRFSCPDYPGDANEAITLTVVLAKEGWNCSLNNGLDTTWECEFSRPAQPSTHPDRLCERDGVKVEIHYGTGATVAEAICDAFLNVKWLLK